MVSCLLIGGSLLLRALVARVMGHGGYADDPDTPTSHHVVVLSSPVGQSGTLPVRHDPITVIRVDRSP
jgi:hypothetical protein